MTDVPEPADVEQIDPEQIDPEQTDLERTDLERTDLERTDLERADDRMRTVRRTVLAVAALNLGYFFVEAAVALAIGSVSLLADSVDFLEDTAVNLLIVLALGWSLRARSRAGKVMALVILVPAVAAAWQVVDKIGDPVAPAALPLVLAALGAVVVNATCALLLVRIRHHAGSMTTAAWLAARNDVLVNVAIVAVGGLTAWTGSAWPDIVLGAGIIVLGLSAAKEVWEVAEEERLGAMALAGEDPSDERPAARPRRAG